MKIEDVLSSDPEIVSGAVVFKGTRVPAEILFQYLRAGETLEEFIHQFPTVRRDQAEAVLQVVSEEIDRKFHALAA